MVAGGDFEVEKRDKFPACLLGRREGGAVDELLGLVGAEAHFLLNFSFGGVEVGFSRVDVASRGVVPAGWVHVFEAGAFLEESARNVALFVVVGDADVGGSVDEILRVDFLARDLAEDLIVFIDDVEQLVRILSVDGLSLRVVEIREFDPLHEAEFLGAGAVGEIHALGDFAPVGVVGEIFFELFASLGEAAADELVEIWVVKDREILAREEHGDGRVDLRAREKCFGRDGAEGVDVPSGLDAEGEDAVVFRARRGVEAVDDFFLEHNHGALEGVRWREKIFHDRAACGVG